MYLYSDGVRWINRDSIYIESCLPLSRAGRPRQTAHPDFLKMLACNFLLKLSYKSCDFEPLQAQIGQVPICGLLGASKWDHLGPLCGKSLVLSGAKAHKKSKTIEFYRVFS